MYGDHRDRHVRTHSFPTRRSSDLVTVIRDGALPPMPWLNVVANPDFGFTTTEAGGGYAWSQNSQRNPITPWANDPVSDPPQEVLYLRSEEHTSELQSLMRISYAVFCLKKKKNTHITR